MTSANLIAAAQRQLVALTAQFPGVIVLDGVTHAGCAVLAERGMVKDSKCGFRQGRALTVHLAYNRIAPAVLVDSRGVSRRLSLTHLGVFYRLTEDGVEHDPHRITWILTAAEVVV